MAGWPRSERVEESPDSRERWRRVTPARGNPRESATEMRPPEDFGPKARVKRWGKSPPRRRQRRRHGKPRLEQGQIGIARGPVARAVPRVLPPERSGLAARACRRRQAQRNGHRRLPSRHRIRLTGHPRTSILTAVRFVGGLCPTRDGSDAYNFSDHLAARSTSGFIPDVVHGTVRRYNKWRSGVPGSRSAPVAAERPLYSHKIPLKPMPYHAIHNSRKAAVLRSRASRPEQGTWQVSYRPVVFRRRNKTRRGPE